MTVNSVLQELKDFRSKMNSDVMLQTNKLKVSSPDPLIIETVKNKILELDPKTRLSKTDIEVLSLAKQEGGVLVTNDLALQNIAKQIRIPIYVISGKEITEIRKTYLKCKNCKTVIRGSHQHCPDCGGEVKEYFSKENLSK